MVAATHFKKKIGREVKDMVDDKQSRVELYKKIHTIKKDRHEKNMQNQKVSSANPNKERLDFIRNNV